METVFMNNFENVHYYIDINMTKVKPEIDT